MLYLVAYQVRPKFTDHNTRRYFIPALTVKFIGAIFLGLIYQFYYSGGDTYNFTTRGSLHIWEAFLDSPLQAIELLFANGQHQPETFEYSSQIVFFRDSSSFFVIRLAAIFGFFTFHTYSSIALFFAAFSFSGLWAFYQTFYRNYPKSHFLLAIACLFVPSVFFWGSGVLKDTLTMGAIGWFVFSVYELLVKRKFRLRYLFVLIMSAYFILSIKLYIFLCLVPASLFWVSSSNLALIRKRYLRILVAPVLFMIGLGVGYFAITQASSLDNRYALNRIAETARITAYDIRYYTGKDAGSGYDLGELDGTIGSMVRLAPAAINVSLFRPYLWEVSNILMFISSAESTAVLLLTLYILFYSRGIILKTIRHPDIAFCLIFAFTFAFAVGISTYNFGSLVRYKIPLMPFYLSALVLIYHWKRFGKSAHKF